MMHITRIKKNISYFSEIIRNISEIHFGIIRLFKNIYNYGYLFAKLLSDVKSHGTISIINLLFAWVRQDGVSMVNLLKLKKSPSNKINRRIKYKVNLLKYVRYLCIQIDNFH